MGRLQQYFVFVVLFAIAVDGQTCWPRIHERVHREWRVFEARCRAPHGYGTGRPFGSQASPGYAQTYGRTPLMTDQESRYLNYFGASYLEGQPQTLSQCRPCPPSAFFAPGTKPIQWEGARFAVAELLMDKRHRIFDGPGLLAPPPPDAMHIVNKISRVGIAMLPNLCNDAELLKFKEAVREHLALHVPSIQNYVEGENYCGTLLSFMDGEGRADVARVLQNFAT